MRAEVAVIGGGSTGSSVLYHLAKSGVKNCLLIERGNAMASVMGRILAAFSR